MLFRFALSKAAKISIVKGKNTEMLFPMEISVRQTRYVYVLYYI